MGDRFDARDEYFDCETTENTRMQLLPLFETNRVDPFHSMVQSGLDVHVKLDDSACAE